MLFKDDFPNKGKKRAISRPFAIAIRAARLYTAWLCYRSYVVVGLKTSIPTIQECLLSSARSFARSKTRSLCFVAKARSVLDLRARVVLAPISKGAYAFHS